VTRAILVFLGFSVIIIIIIISLACSVMNNYRCGVESQIVIYDYT